MISTTKSTKLFVTAASFFALAASANASDLGIDKRTDIYEPAPAQEYVANPFAGFYGGGQVGGEFVNVDWFDMVDGSGADGLIGGAHAGYNFCAGNFCTGPYAEGGWSNVNNSAGPVDVFNQEWYAQGGWIVGYRAWKASFIYAKAAYEFSSWKFMETVDVDVQSYVLGGGIDAMVADHVSVGIFADYLVPSNIDVGGTDFTDELEQSEALRAGVKLTIRQ